MELKISIFTIGTFLYYTQANGPLEIPPEVQERLRSVKTRADFEASFTVDRGEKLPGARNTVHTGDGAGFPGGMKSQLRPSAGNYRSSVDSEPEIFKVKTIELTAAVPPTALSIDGPDAEVITDPIQSEDTCLKMNVCVPVPIKREPLVYYFPQCIQLEQCLGACCDGQQQCHAQEEANVQVLVEKWEYEGYNPVTRKPEFSSKSKQMVRMKKHISCGCKPCSRSKRCAPKQEFKQCECQCTNQTEALSCTGNWKWNSENCECSCGISTCPANRILNPVLCRCIENFRSITPVPNGAAGLRATINISNLAKLPKLTYQKRNRSPGIRPQSST